MRPDRAVCYASGDVQKARIRRSLLAACAVVLGCAVALAAGPGTLQLSRVQTDDRNHDGRPDVWRFFDAQGRLTRVAIDTNFDGRPDQEEQYQHDGLTRRSSDRNFDRRIDLIEEFDPTTHERVRSLVDVDFDGRADLLVLFADESPVHAEWAQPVAPLAGTAAPLAGGAASHAPGTLSEVWTTVPGNASDDSNEPGQLAKLEDPFAAMLAFRADCGLLSPDGFATAALQALVVDQTMVLSSALPPDLVVVSPSGLRPRPLSSLLGSRAPPSGAYS